MLEILKYEKASKNKVIGYVDVKIKEWGLTIRRIAHLDNGTKQWFNFPTYYVEMPDAKRNFISYLHLENHTRFFDALSNEVKKYLEEQNAMLEKSHTLDAEIPF